MVLLASIGSAGAASKDAESVSKLRPVELPHLRTARSETFAQPDGSFKTVVSSLPIHYRDGARGWKKIKNELVESKRAGFKWANGEAGFRADLKEDAREGVLRFEAGGAGFALTLEGATPSGGAKLPAPSLGVGKAVGAVYKNVFKQTDLEYALLPTGVKETLVLQKQGAPHEFVFQLQPLPGKEFTLLPRPDGGLDVRTAASAVPVAVISAPVVNDSRPIDRFSDAGVVPGLADSVPAAGKASMSVEGDAESGYRIVLRIDERWLESPERVFPVRLDPTITTAVDIQDGYIDMNCGSCTPQMSSNALHIGGNGTVQYSSAMLFSLADIPAGATVSSARLDMYQTGCWNVSGCGWFWGNGQDGTARVYQLTSPWGPNTPAASLTWNGTPLAERAFSMWWSGDQPAQWKSWEGAGLAAHVQGVINGSPANHGLYMNFSSSGWGPIFASSRYSDPSYAPQLQIQWVADGVQLHPATNIHSDGAELTWSRFAAGYGPYAASVLQDNPRAYWRMNDAAGSPFGLVDWSGNSLHASPIGMAHGQAGATADGDTSVYYNGSSSRTEASESQITDTFTIEAWVKRGTLGGKQTIFARGESNGGGFRLLFNNSNQLELAQGDVGGTVATSNTTVADTTAWHHVAATKSGGTIRLYIDGTDRTGAADTYTMTNGLGLIVTGAAIGSDYECECGARWYAEHFNGWIDEPAVYASVLSEARLDAHIAARSEPGSGFQRFEVHRSLQAGFAPTAATLIATVRDPAIQYYRDTTAKASTTFHYKIVTVGTGGSYTSNQLAVTTPASGNATITVQPGVSLMGAEATTLASGSLCANNGGAGGITASSSQRALLRFDLRQIPTGSEITDADVSLWTFQNGGSQSIALHRASADWTEGTGTGACNGSGATWKDRQANVPWATEGSEFASPAVASFSSSGATPHWESADITSLVDDWANAGSPNLGLLVKHATEAGATPITWTSDEYSGSAALRPKLVITYADGSDPKEPSVSIGAPGDGAKVSGAVNITAAAGDDSKVSQVEFLRGGNVYGTDTAAPWEATLDASALAAGTSHELVARATDDVGHVTSSSPITVIKKTAAPTVGTVTASNQGSGVWDLSTSASDDVGVSKVDFFADGNRIGSDSSAPFSFSWNTLPPAAGGAYDGSRDLTASAHDADGQTATSAATAITIANTTGTPFRAGYSTSAIPLEFAYDANVQTQEKQRVIVTITNNSTGSWSAATTHLRYRWLAPDGTTSASGNISLGSDLAAAGQRGIDLDVDPPSLPAGVARSLYTLRIDLYDSGAGAYFADQGNQPIERHVLVTRATTLELGLERYQQYEPLDLGAGMTASANLASGNLVVSTTLLDNPGRGLSTLLDLTYNSQEPASFSPVGAGFSLGTGLARLGQPLDIHPNASDTALGRTSKWIGFADVDGSYHRFQGRTISGGDTYYDQPAGVHLYLRATGSSDASKYWALTRPDRVTFYFDQEGWPTRVEDANANALVYTLTAIPAGEDAYGLAKRVSTISDAGGRDVTLAYYAKAETATPALRGKLKSLTDHAGRITYFDYYDDGRLLKVRQAGGVGDDGGFLPARARLFTYTNTTGNEPAIATLAARKNPDPATTQGSLLYSAIDYRGNETSFAYSTTGPTAGRLSAWTDRAAKTTSFSYTIAEPDNPMTFSPSLDGYARSDGALPYPPAAGTSAHSTGGTIEVRKQDLTSVDGTSRVDTGLLRFDTSSLPDGATVTAATLRLWIEGKGTSGRNLTGEWYDPGATIDTGDWTATAAADAADLQTMISDAFTRTAAAGAGWGATDVGGSWAHSSNLASPDSSKFGVNGASGTMALSAANTSVHANLRMNDTALTDTDTLIRLKLGTLPTGARVEQFLHARVQASNSYYALRFLHNTDGTGTIRLQKRLPAATTDLGSSVSLGAVTAESWYWIRFRVIGSELKGKVWADGGSEPDWQLTATDTDLAHGGVSVRGLVSSSNTNLPTLLWDDLLVRASTSLSGIATGAALDLALQNMSNINLTGSTGIRLHISGGAPATDVNHRVKLSADEHASNPPPQLLITHTTPATATTTVARPLSRTSSYDFDNQGRVTKITNPLGLTTSVDWTNDNAVEEVTNDTTGRSTTYAYNANGYLTESTDEKGSETHLTYEDIEVDADDVAANWPAGRLIPHFSQLETRTLPNGVATPAANDYTWSFEYTASGNLATITDPLSKQTTHTYNADGTLATTTLPENEDGIAGTTTFESYDANGLPTQVRDAAGNRAKADYGADGRPLWIQDPIHYADTGSESRSYRQVYDYDGYGRLIRSSSPKSSTWARGLLIWSETRYDLNDNTAAELSPYYAIEAGSYGLPGSATHDAMDRPTSVVGPDTSSGGIEETKTAYDAAGRIEHVIAPKGALTALAGDFTLVTTYDLLDRPASESRYQHDGAGQIVSANTRTTSYCYDAAGDLRSITGPKGASGFSCPSATAWPYTPTSHAYTTKIIYDAAHQPTTVTDPLGRETSTEYDANGWVVKETDALEKERTFEYDQRGNRTKMVAPFDTGRTLTSITEYDALGNVTREISPRAYDAAAGGPTFTDYVTSYSYDALGQLVRVALPKASAETQAHTHNAYDANGRLLWTSLPTTEITPANVAAADKTVNEYWDSGQLYATTVGGSPKVRYDQTAEGWQHWRLPETAEGTGVADYARMMFWEYYPDGQLKAERDLAGQRSSYGYDANGNQTSAAEAQSIAGDVLTVASSFNGFDELERVRTPRSSAANYWASSLAYDQHGNVESLEENREEAANGTTVSAGRVFGYLYDAADQPTHQSDDVGTAGTVTDDERFSFEFDELGRLKKRTVEKRTGASSYATTLTQESGYFFNGLPKTLLTKDGAGATVASHTLSYLQGGVYLNGNKTQDVFRLANPDTNAPCRTVDCTASWEYDSRERLTKAIDGIPATGTTSEFTLDPAGNMTLEKRNGSTYRTATYAGQRLATDSVGGVSTRYLYDAQGNVDCVVLAAWGSNSCPTASTGQSVASELLSDNVYDYRNRLIAVRGYDAGIIDDRVEYRFDPLSRPVKKVSTENGTTTTTEMVYLGVSDAVVRETVSGAAPKTRSYAFDVLGDRASLSEAVSGTTVRLSYVYDPLGSAELLLDQANDVKASYGYTAYGEANPQLTKTAAGFSPDTNLYRYSAKRWDPAAKAYDMGARHYFPAQGRWFQQDLYSNAFANLGLSSDPLTQNRYAFTGANPINYVEIDGHVVGHANQVADAGFSCETVAQMTFPQCNVSVRAEPVDMGPIADATGITDVVKCVKGSAGSCVWAVVGVTPVGKAAKAAKAARAAKPATKQGAKKAFKLWTPREVAGRRVYQRDDLIDATRVNARGDTSLSLMKRGRAPIGADGRPLQLHHLIQKEPGAMAELTQALHQRLAQQLHVNPSNTLPSGIDRAVFRRWKSSYWKLRARDFG